MRNFFWIVFILSLLALPAGVYAQDSVDFQWNRWDVVIDVQPDSDTLAISETQEFALSDGTVRFGSRAWTDPVDVNDVFVVMGGDANPVQLSRADAGEEPGTYTVSQSGNETELRYYLPTPAQSGDTFVAQINYAAPVAVEGLVDWVVIPGDHAAPVQSSTVTINFPSGETPDPSLVRVAAGSGSVEQNGNSFTIQTPSPLASDQMLAIQVPFGANVGAAGEAPGEVEPAPDAGSEDDGNVVSGDTWTLILLGGIVLLVLLGGGGLLRRLTLPTPDPDRSTRNYNPFPAQPREGAIKPPPNERGFRRSTDQDRDLPQVDDRKDSGGSAGLG